MEYYSFNKYMRDRFGTKVYKIALDAGLTCPNRDGTIDTRGCIFCSEGGSGEFAQKITLENVKEQLENAKKSMVDVLNMNPSVNLMGTADLSVAYSKDFTRLVVSGQEKDLQERVLLSQDIAALLILQIMNGVSCDDAQAALELNYTDTGKQEVKELNCYNY